MLMRLRFRFISAAALSAVVGQEIKKQRGRSSHDLEHLPAPGVDSPSCLYHYYGFYMYISSPYLYFFLYQYNRIMYQLINVHQLNFKYILSRVLNHKFAILHTVNLSTGYHFR